MLFNSLSLIFTIFSLFFVFCWLSFSVSLLFSLLLLFLFLFLDQLLLILYCLLFSIFTIGISNTYLPLIVSAPAVNSPVSSSCNSVVLSASYFDNLIVFIFWIELPDSDGVAAVILVADS